MIRFKGLAYDDNIKKRIKKYQLGKQFLKAINYIKQGDLKAVKFKFRQPKSKGIYYFRINRQYRAWCKIIDDILFITNIDNHSD